MSFLLLTFFFFFLHFGISMSLKYFYCNLLLLCCSSSILAFINIYYNQWRFSLPNLIAILHFAQFATNHLTLNYQTRFLTQH